MKYSALICSIIVTYFIVACSQHTISKIEPIPEANPSAHSLTSPSIPEVTNIGVKPSKAVVYPKGVKRPQLSEHELRLISQHIYFNEASAKPENLMKWNDNEHFVSLGMGHFIWYPAGITQRFDQTFPDLITYLQDHQVRIPYWLLNAQNRGAPWPNKLAFLQSQDDPEVRELKRILLNTKELQTLFFFDRIHESIPTIVRQASETKRKIMIHNYNTMINTPNGWYPLIDYINFKGKGVKSTERYNNEGWGLSQVLQEMKPVNVGSQALQEFAKAALYVLKRRLNNAPVENNEENWLPGWKKRISTYTQPL